MKKLALVFTYYYSEDESDLQREYELNGKAYSEGFRNVIVHNYSDESFFVTKENIDVDLLNVETSESVIESLEGLGYEVIEAEDYYNSTAE